MEIKTKKVKWTKKFKALFISISLALAVALGGACAAIGISVAGRNGRWGGTFAGGVADRNTPQLPDVAETFYAGATVGDVTYATNAEAWAAAVKYSVDNTATVQFNLTSNWAATVSDTTSSFGESVGDEQSFFNGIIYVPKGASIVLNLNGKTVDRKLVNQPLQDNGNVIAVEGTLYLTGKGTVTGGHTGSGTGIAVLGGGTFNMYDGTISGNLATANGGGVWATTNATFNMYGGEISDNTANSGGGVYVSGGAFTMYGGEISDNSAINGGGLYAEKGSDVTITNAVIDGNTADERGGGFYTIPSAIITNTQFSNNEAKLYGGGVAIYMNPDGEVGETDPTFSTEYSKDHPIVKISGGKMFGNKAGASGAAIIVAASSYLEIEGTEIYENTAQSIGGALYAGSSYSGYNYVKITNVNIHDNIASRSGGIGWNENVADDQVVRGKIQIVGSFINDNIAKDGAGGGVGFFSEKQNELHQAELSIQNTQINNNTAAGNGGGIYINENITSTITGGTVSGNKATRGGGIYSLGTLEMIGGEIIGNRAVADYSLSVTNGNYGGHIGGILATKLTMTGVKITGNASEGNIGGLKVDTDGVAEISKCEINNNNAIGYGEIVGEAGGIYLEKGASLTMDGGTVSENTSKSNGAGIYLNSGASLTITSGFITNNSAVNGGGGGIFTNSGVTLRLNGSLVDGKNSIQINNNISTQGGGLCVNGSDTIMSYVTFDNNYSSADGGGLSIYSFTADHITVTNNTTVNNGGGLRLHPSYTYTINNSTITGNTALNGGGIYSTGAVSLTGTTITGNEALNNGGGFYHSGTSLSLGGSAKITIKDNHSTQLTDNVYITSGKGIGLFDGGRNVEVGVSSEVPLTFITGATTVVPFNNNGTQTGFFPDIPANYEIAQSTVSGKYNYALNSKLTGTLAQRWSAAVNNSSTGNPQLFEMTENWTAARSTAGFGSGVGFLSNGSLEVPAGKDVILDLKGFTLNRNSGTGFGSDVIKVYGKLTIKGSGTITGGIVEGVGGGINVYSGELVLNGGTISGHSTQVSGGGVRVYSGATFTMNGGTISGNTAADSGGGVYVEENGTFTMNGGKISNNHANGNSQETTGNAFISGGGGVYVVGGTFEMNGGTISGNDVSRMSGGAVFAYNGATFNMNGGTISGNTATANGGAMEIYKSEFNMTGGMISGNSTIASGTGNGGGFYVKGTSVMNISGGTISGNSAASGDGMGIFLTDGGPTLNLSGNAEIKNHTSTKGNGGAGVYVYPNAKFNMTGGTISGNSALSGGGVYVAANSTFNMDGGTISGNTASGGPGGGIFSLGTLNIKSGDIMGNKAPSTGTVSSTDTTKEGRGGGIWAAGGKVNIGDKNDSTKVVNISDNTAYISGGGIYIYDSVTECSIYNAKINGNTSTTADGAALIIFRLVNDVTTEIVGGEMSNNKVKKTGGAIYTTHNLSISNCRITNNTAESNGGGIYAYSETVTIDGDTVISGNTAASGGALYINTGATFTMNGGTITKNTATVNGGGIYANAATFTMNDGEISYNTSGAAGGGIDGSAANSTVTLAGGSIHHNVSGAHGGGLSIGATATDMATVTVSGDMEVYGNESRGGNGGGGLYIEGGVTLTMDGGKIYDNSANQGGGVCLYSLSNKVAKFTMSDGEIYGNISTHDGSSAQIGGGGVFVNATSIFDFQNGTISGNESYRGGGILNVGTLNMTGGTLSENTALNIGSGIYNRGTITINGENAKITGNTSGSNGGGIFQAGGTTEFTKGLIDDNTANYGGGVQVDFGSFTINGGIISNNTAYANGGGIYISNSNASYTTTAELVSGSIINNTAAGNGGGVMIGAGVFTMSGGIISDNSANVYGGGIYVNGTLQLKGNSVVTENFANGNLNNVYLPTDKKITVSGALGANARIGVSTESEVPVTVTSGYTTSGNTAANARNIFCADNEGVVAVCESNEIVLKQGVVLTVNDDKGTKIGSISTVSGAEVAGSFDEKTRIYTLAESNALANTEGLTFTSDVVPEGYAAYMYAYGDVNKTEITKFTMGNSAATVCLGVKALDRDYTIHYYLQNPDGSYGTTFITGTHSGLTDSAVVVVDGDGKPFATQISTPEQYSVDNTKGDWQNATVAGDGSTVVEVYLKLNEYTVTFSAAGASNVERARSLRYGEAITEPTRTPIKALSSFDYWSYDEAGENRVDFDTAIVTGNVTLYAQFTTRKFSVKFDLNVGDGDNQIPAANSNKLAPIAGGNIHGDKVLWNHESLFDESFGFKAGADAGEYLITYTIDNVSSNKRINGIVPSAVGYTFTGWFEAGATRATTVISTPDEYTDTEIVLTARWSRTQYAIRFDPQNGSRVTSKTVPNITAWESILTEPVRGGYKFLGWYVSNDNSPENENYMDAESFSRTRNEQGKKVFSISDFVVKGLFPAGSTSITLYAQWESMPVLIETVEDEEKGGMSFAMDGSDLPDTNPTVYIGKDVDVKVTAKPGFRFKNLTFYLQDGTKETLRDGVTTFTVTSRFVCKGTNELTQEEYSFIKVEAVYSEERYTITYHTDGGRAEDTSFARSYSASELLSTSNNRAKLPSRLTKNGWDFAGWIFESTEEWPNPQYAHATVPSGESYYGAELWLVQPYSLDDAQEATYRNVVLKATWKAQAAKVYLYNATYTDNIKYDKDTVNNYYFIDEDDAGNPLVTKSKINIANPERDSFDFLGWATTRNGAVVYPAAEGKDTIEYVVNPDHDANGSALNRNNLYAVWHVKGVNYIIMSATNNGATYGGDGIIMSAKPAQNYTDNDANIRLNYYWYRVFDGMYDQCFTVTDYVDKDGFKWYLDESGNIVSYEKDGVYYDENKEVISAPVGTKFTIKDFNPAAVGVYCEEGFKRENVAASETPNVTVTDVADSGIYICVVDVVATEGSGSTTRESGYGEIEITMNKAVYGGLSMEDARVEYNTKQRADEVTVKGLTVTTENGLRTITLPDGSKVNVTYTYYLGAGELKENDPRQPITDLSLIKNVGEYHVVANFEFAVGGDKGNYEPLATLEADLYILADVLSALDYPFMHDGKTFNADEEYTGTYDGKSYGVDVIIKDTLSINAGSQLVTDVDDVAVDVKVYRVTENGDVEIPAASLPTVDAGTYAVVIVGLKGEAASNYVLGTNVEMRKEYTISKLKYDVAGHIHFDDVDDVVFDNEVHLISIEIDDGYSLPSTVTATYKRTASDYIPADKDFTQGREPNDFDNGGRYAGTYNVTVEFIDTEAGNHEPLESMTATLTINKANFFDFYNVDGTDLLRDGGFVSRSYALKLGVKYNPAISGSMLNDTEHFALTYTYYRVNGQTRTDISDGAHTLDELTAMGDLISHEGKYEIVAHIAYKSALYRNNFEDIKDSDCVIAYEISGVPVESVEVTFTDKFISDGKVVSLGEGFNYNWIKQIKVKYAGDTGTLNIDKPDDILLAGIRFEDKNGAEQNTFWHVGDFTVYVSYYEKESVAYTLTVKEAVEEFKLKYSVDGGAYEVVPEGGLELLTDGRQYSFIIEYSCTDGNGATVTESSDAVIAAGGLVLGKNVLTVTEDFYTFGEVSVDMYEVLTGVKWQFSLDGESWTDFPASKELSYAGKAYSVKAVYGEGANEKSFIAHTQSKKDALNVGDYVMEIGRSGDYRIDEVYSFKITPKKLSFEWNKNSFEYDMLSHTPTIVSSGLEQIDEGIVTFGFNYYDSEKNRILSASSIITVGTYYVSVTMGGDLTARSNYTLTDAENAEYYEFEIVRAAIKADVYYSESNYGRDISYAGNTELRLNALKADFGENAQVAGRFQFIKPVGDSYEVVDGKSFAAGLENSGELTVHYLYIPDNKNFNELRGTVTLNVLEPTFRTGEGALSVEFGNGAIQFYLVNQVLDTYGIDVYRLYESTYQENGVWYGARERIANPIFRLEGYNGSITNYVITSLDLSGGKIVLIARDGSDSGKLEIPVIDKTAQGMEVANPDGYRKTYYVGETPDFSDIVFRILFGDDTPSVDVNVGTVKTDYTGGELTEGITTFSVTFTYFSINIKLDFNVAQKEDLTVVLPKNTVLTFTGDEIAVPELKFTVDGNTIGQNALDGVNVKVALYFGEDSNRRPVTFIKDKGKYTVVYTFEITNPRFKPHDPENVSVEVTAIPYEVDATLPESGQTAFTGEEIELPKPTIGQVTDRTNNFEPVSESRVIRVYTVYDEKRDVTEEVKFGDAWTVVHSGRYVITVTVRVAQEGGAEPLTAWTGSYEFVVTQAKNDLNNASVTGPDFVLKGADGSIDFSAFKAVADFGADAVIWEYSTSRDSGYKTDRPTKVGTYYVRARIAETDDYQGLTTLSKLFEVRDTGIELSGGEGSITGENGIGENWSLEIKHMDSDAVSQTSISKQNVLDGYEVLLKKANGTVVKDEGAYTVRVKLSEELSGRNDLKVFFKDAAGNTKELKATVKDGYVEFTTSEFGTFMITSAVAGAPVGLLVAVIVLGVVAAGGIAACIIVFVKKRKKGEQK